MEGSDRRWRGAMTDGGERQQVERSDLRRRGAIVGGGERPQVEESGGERSQEEGRDDR